MALLASVVSTAHIKSDAWMQRSIQFVEDSYRPRTVSPVRFRMGTAPTCRESERGRSGSVEKVSPKENHDVVGQHHQAEISALTVITAAANVSALTSLDHRHDRFHLAAFSIDG